MSAFVLDNSVTMRWCFDSSAHAYADQVLGQLETRRSAAFVPVLWRYEVSAVVARAQIKEIQNARAAMPIATRSRCAGASRAAHMSMRIES